MRIAIALLAILAMACVAQAGEVTETILIDFGEPELVDGNANLTYLPAPEPPWNNMDGNSALALDNTAGNPTGITATTTGFATDGVGGVDANNLYVHEAQYDYVGCAEDQPSSVTLTGLTEAEYTIVVFGSRSTNAWGAPSFRSGKFSVDGWANHAVQDHMANTTEKLIFSDVAPVGGTITLDVLGSERDLLNGVSFNYAYLNVMEILVPEPATMSLLALGGVLAIRRRRR